MRASPVGGGSPFAHLPGLRGVWGRLLRHALPYRRLFLLAMGALVVQALTQPAVPALLKPLLDGSFVTHDGRLVERSALLLVLVFAVRGGASYLGALGLAAVGSRVVRDLRVAMFERLLALPIARLEALPSGTIISRLTYDAQQVAEATSRVVMVLVADTLTVLALLAWMAWLDWRLTLLALATAPFVVVTVGYFSRRLRRMSRSLQDEMGLLTEVLREALDGARVVRIFGGETRELGRLARAANRARQYQIKFASAANATGPIAQTVISIALAGIVVLIARRASTDPVSVGSFVSFLAAMILLFPPIRRLTAVNGALQRGLAAAESVFHLMDEPVEIDEGRAVIERARGEVHYEKVTFRYQGQGPPALEEVDLVLEPGEMLALVGPSGSGKSTVASLLPRFYDPSRGRVTLDGHDVRELTLASLRRQIAYVGQEVVLFDDTLAANIAYGALGGCSREAVEAAAAAAHVLEFAATLPRGLDTRVGERGTRLSGGQRQRVAIARAFLKDAPVLILDEATSALDPLSEAHVQSALERLREGRATLVIAHRLSTIERADRIAVMLNGRVVETGRHEALLAQGGVYAGLYRAHLLEPGPATMPLGPPASRPESDHRGGRGTSEREGS